MPGAAPARKFRASLTILLVAGLLTGPAPQAATGNELPALGDNADISVSLERKIGERIARDLYRDADYIDDPLLQEYVESIWQDLLAAARQRGELSPELEERFAFEVLLGRDRSINAFAVPGGYLGMNLGLIGVVSSADELASVLAHELTHVTQRHIARQISRQNQQTPLLIASMILGALVASKSPEAAQALITGGQGLVAANQLGFSRDVEREADRIGFAVMAQAGFDSRAFGSMFEKLQQASRLNDSGSFPYLRTHPLTSERIASVRERLALAEGSSVPERPLLAEHAMLAARARVLARPDVDQLRGWVAQAQADPASGSSPAQQAAVAYAGALAASQLRDHAQARQMADQLSRLLARLEPGAAGSNAPLTRPGAPLNTRLPTPPSPRGAAEAAQGERATRLGRLLQAELALAQGQASRAAQWLDSTAPMRPELMLWAQTQLALGVPDATGKVPASAAAVAQRLQSWLATHPRDALAWQRLGVAYQQQNLSLRALRAEAESHAVRFDYGAALDRFKAGQQAARAGAGATDQIEASIIDSRARQMEALLKEQQQER